jgi:hypothetical protein
VAAYGSDRARFSDPDGSAGGEINARRRACAHINPFGRNPGDRADGWVVDHVGGSVRLTSLEPPSRSVIPPG